MRYAALALLVLLTAPRPVDAQIIERERRCDNVLDGAAIGAAVGIGVWALFSLTDENGPSGGIPRLMLVLAPPTGALTGLRQDLQHCAESFPELRPQLPGDIPGEVVLAVLDDLIPRLDQPAGETISIEGFIPQEEWFIRSIETMGVVLESSRPARSTTRLLFLAPKEPQRNLYRIGFTFSGRDEDPLCPGEIVRRVYEYNVDCRGPCQAWPEWEHVGRPEPRALVLCD